MTNVTDDKYYGFRVSPIQDGELYAVEGVRLDGTSRQLDFSRSLEDAAQKKLGLAVVAATVRFPGTYNGILAGTIEWAEACNGRRRDDVVAANLSSLLDVTFEIERLVAESGLRWNKTIDRTDVASMAGRLLWENVSLGSRNVSPQRVAQAAFNYATTSNDELCEEVEPFIAEWVRTGTNGIRYGNLLQNYYEVVREHADERYSAPELAEDQGPLFYEFMREMPHIVMLDQELLHKFAAEAVNMRALKAGLVRGSAPAMAS